MEGPDPLRSMMRVPWEAFDGGSWCVLNWPELFLRHVIFQHFSDDGPSEELDDFAFLAQNDIAEGGPATELITRGLGAKGLYQASSEHRFFNCSLFA